MIIRQNKKEKDFELFDYKEPEKIEIVQEDPLPEEEEKEKKTINKNILYIIGGALVLLIIIILLIVLFKGKKYNLNVENNQVLYLNRNNIISAEVLGENIKNINCQY